MAISPPKERLWWNEPLHRPEIIWITVAFLWGIVMFAAMIYWHLTGEQNLSNEAYRVDPEVYAAKAEDMIAKYQVREEGTRAYPWCILRQAATSISSPVCGSGIRYWNLRRTRVTGFTCHRWTGNMGFRSSPSISMSRSIRTTTWS